MSIKIKQFIGGSCTAAVGCNISLETNVSPQKFNLNKSYYLLRGGIVVDYEGENTVNVVCPYNSNWNPYVDQWNYDKNVILTTTPNTKFTVVSVTEGNTNNAVAFTSSVLILENSNLTKTMNANSYLLVFGSAYSIDSVHYHNINGQSRTIFANSPREVQISTSNSCELIYLETI